ncbi:MAG: 3-deoxy-D-manno-octulosonic acid transferase [Planctomycetes bacterium]|nr:3-deoxy-D-manno-octulosonic acid transferase [Planctomycetota bacterium]
MALLVDLVYVLAVLLATPYLVFCLLTREKYRAGLRERVVGPEPRRGLRPAVWIHGVSVGEILAARSVIEALRARDPEVEVCISTTTATGHEVARRSFPGLRVFFFPLDLSFCVSRAFRAIRPSLVVLVELEIWPNFLHHAYRFQVPVILINGRISAGSYRGYVLVKRWLFRPLMRIRHYCVQNEVYASRFQRLGVPAAQVSVTGSLKYDNISNVDPDAMKAEVHRELGLPEGDPVLLCGSTHDPEEQWLLEAFLGLRAAHPGLRLIIVPRHPPRAGEVAAAVVAAGLRPVLRTAMARGLARLGPATDVLVVDTVGDLARFYTAATVVFVGGSLVPHGGQNMLEPAGLGRVGVFGPHVFNFADDAKDLVEAGGAFQVRGRGDLEAAIGGLLADPARLALAGEKARRVVRAGRGATRRTLDTIEGFLPEPYCAPAVGREAAEAPLRADFKENGS